MSKERERTKERKKKKRKALDKKGLQDLTAAVFVQSLLDYLQLSANHTCHVFKGECGWGIAP